MRYLAMDPGERRIGLAVGDDETRVANPLGVIEAGSPAQRWAALKQAVAEHEPDALVLGLPLNADGTEGPAAAKARQLALQLEERFGLPVHLVDERLSSFAADQLMSQSGLTRKQKKLRRDALAAMTILRHFLDSLKG